MGGGGVVIAVLVTPRAPMRAVPDLLVDGGVVGWL